MSTLFLESEPVGGLSIRGLQTRIENFRLGTQKCEILGKHVFPLTQHDEIAMSAEKDSRATFENAFRWRSSMWGYKLRLKLRLGLRIEL